MGNNLGNKETMARNIRKYMDLNQVTSVDMCRVLDVPQSTFSYWIHAKTYPRIDKIEKMAKYFGISKADLVEEDPVWELAYRSSEDQHLLHLFHKADEFDQQTIWHILSRYDEEGSQSSKKSG